MTNTYQVVGLGAAIVDALATCTDGLLEDCGIEKGVMSLVDRPRAEELYQKMEAPVQTAGGSVANTLSGLSSLGVSTGFIGRVGDDALGRDYSAKMQDDGIAFLAEPAQDDDTPTARCMIFVTDDGERSMNTYLGISPDISPATVEAAITGEMQVMFLEGYLYDKPEGKAAFDHAVKLTRDAGGEIGLSLSDPFCVDRHRDDFRAFVKTVDFVIGNEHEWTSLYECDLPEALAQARADCRLVVCTKGGAGVEILRADEHHTLEVERVDPVDTTGAGDLFAAGFLYGYINGDALDRCGTLGAAAAAEVIQKVGPRPDRSLTDVFSEKGLL